MMPAKKTLAFFAVLVLLGCGGEWVSGEVGRTTCVFTDLLPSAHRPLKIAAGNSGGTLYILDDFYSVHHYKRDNLYDCAFALEKSYSFTGFPEDVLFASNGFYVQDKAQLKFMDDKETCYATTGVFSLFGNELAVGSNTGIQTWAIPSCDRREKISSTGVLALALYGGEYYAVEGNTPQNLAVYPKSGSVRREPLSINQGNEKYFCSADRIAVNNYGIYLLDKKCKRIGVFDNQAYWRKTISLDSLGITDPQDIAAGEYSYIFILRRNGLEKINIY
jgi:hypothetical protein